MQSRPALEQPPFPINAAERQRVQTALVEAIQRNDRSPEALQVAIGDCARTLRAQGMLPEAVLLTMKAFVLHAVPEDGTPSQRGWVSDPLMSRIIEWSVQEYFREN